MGANSFNQQHSLQNSRKTKIKVARPYLEWCEIDGCQEMEEDNKIHLHDPIFWRRHWEEELSYKHEDAFENVDASIELTDIWSNL
jgi:hypothetical protein